MLAARPHALERDHVTGAQLTRLAQMIDPGAIVVPVDHREADELVVDVDGNAIFVAVIVDHEADIIGAGALDGSPDPPAAPVELNMAIAILREQIDGEAVHLQLIVVDHDIARIDQHWPDDVEAKGAGNVEARGQVLRANDFLAIVHRDPLHEEMRG